MKIYEWSKQWLFRPHFNSSSPLPQLRLRSVASVQSSSESCYISPALSTLSLSLLLLVLHRRWLLRSPSWVRYYGWWRLMLRWFPILWTKHHWTAPSPAQPSHSSQNIDGELPQLQSLKHLYIADQTGLCDNVGCGSYSYSQSKN